MKKRQKLLTDEQWQLVEPLLPSPRRRKDNRGRPWASNRACFEGILWILQTGAAWRFLPDEYPSPSTCWRRLKQWEEEGVWLDAWRALLGVLDEEGLLKWDETFLDGSFAPAKKGSAVGKTKRGKGTKWMVLVDGQGLPLGVRLESASPHEVTLAEATLAEVRVPRAKGRPRQKPQRVIADTAYDSDPLRERLRKRGIELIAPYRNNRQQRRHEDDVKCDATNGWIVSEPILLASSVVAVRHEHLLSTYRAFSICLLLITLRHCL